MSNRNAARSWRAVVLAGLCAAGVFSGLSSVAVPAPQPSHGATPAPVGTGRTTVTPAPTAPPTVPPTLAPTATPQASTPPGPPLAPQTTAPAGVLVRFAGQLLDVRGGFVFFTTGDGYRLDPSARDVDYATGKPTTLAPKTGMYARASFDPATGHVVELALSNRPIPAEAAYEDVQRFAISLSSPQPNPELLHKEGITGRPVIVTFTVLVPVATQIQDIIYMQTDQSNWNPQAIRLDRIDALHYRVTLRLNSGTQFLYRYTRGTSQSVEVGRNGIQINPRALAVANLEVKNQDDTVYNWADQNPAGGALPGPDSIPTPYNPQPFPVPFPPRPTLPPGRG